MHKKHQPRVLNILLIPDNEEAPPKNFRIRYTTLNIIAVILGVFFISIVFGIATYSQVLQAALEKNELESEYLQLREQLKRGFELQMQLDTLRAYREKVRNSLQGYVQFADKIDDQVISDKKLVDNDPAQISILTTVPLKAPVVGFVSQEFKYPGHLGIDIVAPEGTPIVAAADGRVIFSGWTPDDGYTVILYHPGGFITHYWHNARNVVAENQLVRQGDVVAYLGNSGESSGPHLHFEIWKDGEPYNPKQFLHDLTIGE